jgi:hypothetical protein
MFIVSQVRKSGAGAPGTLERIADALSVSLDEFFQKM